MALHVGTILDTATMEHVQPETFNARHSTVKVSNILHVLTRFLLHIVYPPLASGDGPSICYATYNPHGDVHGNCGSSNGKYISCTNGYVTYFVFIQVSRLSSVILFPGMCTVALCSA